MKKIILFIFIILNLLNKIKSDELTFAEIIKETDTYSYENYCKPSFLIVLSNNLQINTISGVGSLNIIDYSLIIKGEINTIFKINTNLNIGSYDNFSINVLLVNTTNVIYKTNVIYSCITPPLNMPFDVQKEVFANNPSKFYYTLVLKNIVKPILNWRFENAGNNPFIIEYDGNQLGYDTPRFKLTFIKTVDSALIDSTLKFKVFYGLISNYIQLELNSPITVYSSSICNPASFPIAGSTSKTSSTFWDSYYLISCSTSNVNSTNLFIWANYQDPDISGSSYFDTRQRFKMALSVDGSATYMLISSFIDNNVRPENTRQYNSNLYFNGSPIATQSISYPVLFSPIPNNDITSTYTGHNNSFINKFTFQTIYPFLFPINYQLGSSQNEFNEFTYPYGVLEGNANLLVFGVSKVTNPDKDRDIYLSYKAPLTNILGDQDSSNSVVSDSEVPKIIDLQVYYPRGGDGKYAVLKAHITDNDSGFSFLKYGENLVTMSDLVNGTDRDGYYEKLITVTFSKDCYISDRADNAISFSSVVKNTYSVIGSDSYSVTLKTIPIISAIKPNFDQNVLNVTKFEFLAQNVDIDNGFIQTLHFDYAGAFNDTPVSLILLDTVYGDSLFNPMNVDEDNRYFRNDSLGYFVIDFFIPAKLCTGKVDYQLIVNGNRYGVDYFNSKFPGKADLSVISTSCDEFPPYITNIVYFGGINSDGHYDLQVSTDRALIGWDIEINDNGNGLKSAYFKVVSNLDPVGKSYSFTPSDVISGSKYIGVYRVAFEVSGEYVGQTFSFENIILIDNSNQKSELRYDWEKVISIPISPLIKYQNEDTFPIIVTTPTTSEPTPPELSFLTVQNGITTIDVGQSERSLEILFGTSDDTALSISHLPTIYLEYHLNTGKFENGLTRITCVTSSLVSSVDQYNANYSSTCIIPYGFAANQGYFSYSIYGIVDTSFNFRGYTTHDLIVLPYKNIIPIIYVTNSRVPIIEKTSYITTLGGLFTIMGRHFGEVTNSISVDIEMNSIVTSYSTIKYISNCMIIVELPTLFNSQGDMMLTITKQSIYSNSIIVPIIFVSIPIPTLSPTITMPPTIEPTTAPTKPPINVPCLNNCGGPSRGSCIVNMGCRCIAPYSGLDCLSETIIIETPKINSTSPDLVNEIHPVVKGKSDLKLSTIVSILAIREIEYDGNIKNTHYFNQWNLTSISTNKHLYSTEILKDQVNVSTISATLEWFEQSTTIQFAGSNFTINPSTLKYTISIDKYPFTSKLNTLELIIKSEFKSSKENDVCSSKQVGLNDGIDFTLLSIGDYSFYSKFIKTAIIDNNNLPIGNKEINNFNGEIDKSSFNNIYSYKAILIPYYENSIILDPDFSVLLNSESSSKNSDNSICNLSSNSLTKSQLAGIIVGGVILCVVVVIIIIVLLSPNSKIALKIFYYKLKNKSFKSR